MLLTDFGSAAKVLQREGGRGRLGRRDCLWPVGTPDYIAPEVLESSEEALVTAEEEEEEEGDETVRPGEERKEEEGGYGVGVDWWSMGVVI